MFDSRNTHQIAQLDVWTAQLGFWRRDLPAMQICQAELAHSVSQLRFAKNTALSVYMQEGLDALTDLHAAALQALAQNQSFSVQLLAKDALRLAINVLYVGLDPGSDRFASAMRHYLDGRRQRLTAWLVADPGNATARTQLAQIEAECRQSPWYAGALAWPDLGARAEAVRFGALIHSALAAAADVEHSTMEDVRNILRIEQGDVAEREAAHRYRNARLASDAAYVELASLYMFGNLVEGIALAADDKVAVTIANANLERLEKLLEAHKQTLEAQQSDRNFYIKAW